MKGQESIIEKHGIIILVMVIVIILLILMFGSFGGMPNPFSMLG